MALAHRRPTIRFPRLHNVEGDVQWAVYWNGRRMANGDGAPKGGAVDYAAAIGGPQPLWPYGKIGWLSGGWLSGGWLMGGPHVRPATGWLGMPWLAGPWLQPGGFAEWTFPFDLRNGTYTIGVRFLDKLGHLAAAGEEVTFEVSALPRPATAIRLDSWTPGTTTLALSFDGSPDVE